MTIQEVADRMFQIIEKIKPLKDVKNKEDYEEFIKAYANVLAMVKGTSLEEDAEAPPIDSKSLSSSTRILAYIETAYANARLQAVTADYEREYSGQSVEIDSGNQQTIQTAINDLRDAIDSADDLAEEHKSRLLNRVESLQREFHKKMPDLQRMLGTIMEVGVVLNNAGKKLDSFVDPLKTIFRAVTGALIVLNGLPPATSFLALPAALEDHEGDN